MSLIHFAGVILNPPCIRCKKKDITLKWRIVAIISSGIATALSFWLVFILFNLSGHEFAYNWYQFLTEKLTPKIIENTLFAFSIMGATLIGYQVYRLVTYIAIYDRSSVDKLPHQCKCILGHVCGVDNLISTSITGNAKVLLIKDLGKS